MALFVWMLAVTGCSIVAIITLLELRGLREELRGADIKQLNDDVDVLWDAVFEEDGDPPDEKPVEDRGSNVIAFGRPAA